MNREALAWALVGISAAAFMAMEMFLLTTLVNEIMGHAQRLETIECEMLLSTEREGRQ